MGRSAAATPRVTFATPLDAPSWGAEYVHDRCHLAGAIAPGGFRGSLQQCWLMSVRVSLYGGPGRGWRVLARAGCGLPVWSAWPGAAEAPGSRPAAGRPRAGAQ